MHATDRLALARAIAARTKPRFIEIPRERQRKGVSEAEMTARRGGLTAGDGDVPEPQARYMARKNAALAAEPGAPLFEGCLTIGQDPRTGERPRNEGRGRGSIRQQ